MPLQALIEKRSLKEATTACWSLCGWKQM